MVLGQVERCLFVLSGQSVEAVLEDGGDGAVGDAPDAERPVAGSLETLRRVALAETHDAKTSAVAVLGVRSILKDLTHHSRRMGSALLGPADDTRRRPFEMLGVGLGPVRRIGRELRAIPGDSGRPTSAALNGTLNSFERGSGGGLNMSASTDWACSDS